MTHFLRNKIKRKNKKAVAAIVSTILLILISFIAVTIVWNVVSGVVKKSQTNSNTNLDTMFVGMNIEGGSVYFATGACPPSSNLTFSVTRSFDSANIEKLKITITGKDSGGNSVTSYFNVTAPGPLGTRAYYLDICPIIRDVAISINPLEAGTGKPLDEVEYETDNSDRGTPPGGWSGTPEYSYESTCTETDFVLITSFCSAGRVTELWRKTNTTCGKIEETRTEAYCLPTGYVSFWKFDDNGNDEAGANPGTLTGGGNLVRHGNAEKGTTYIWNNFNGVAASFAHSGSYGFNRTRAAGVNSLEFIPIDTSITYNLSGWFRSFGTAGLSRFYFGFIPYDLNRLQISPQHVNPVLSLGDTSTVLCTSITATDKIVYIKNATNWETFYPARTLYYNHVAFNADITSGNYNDLPNRDLSNQNITLKLQFPNCPINTATCPNTAQCWSITFNTNVGKTYTEGTPIREHKSGSNYMYSVVSSENAFASWKINSSAITGENLYGASASKWWRGTKYAQILILANNGQSTGDYAMGIDDISLTTLPTPTYTGPVFDSGKQGKAVRLDGDDDYVDVGNIDAFTNQITISAWIKPGGSQVNYAKIVNKKNSAGTNYVYSLQYNTAQKINFNLNDGAISVTSSNTVSSYQWYHVIATYDGSTAKIYIDNVVDGTSSGATTIPASTYNARIGVASGVTPTNYFNGSIDNVMIYNKALTANEVTAIYEKQKS